MKFPYRAPFSIALLTRWCAENMPTPASGQTLELNDSQYAWLASEMKGLVKDFGGVPIAFLDAPKL